MKRFVRFGLAPVLLCLSGFINAQQLEPRSFVNLPIDQTFISLGAVHSEGDLSPTPTSPLQDADLSIDLGVLALSRSFALAGDAAKVDFIAGRACYEGSAFFQGEYVDGRRCEYTDPQLKLTWNFRGAPALTLKEFANREQELVVGASLLVSVPVGTFSTEHLINAGTNRWSLQPTLGMSKRTGRWRWEAKAAVTLFEDNDEFFNGILVEQDPLYAVSGHIIYNLQRGSWLSLDANYFSGGETSQNGVDSGDRQDNSRWGVTWSKPLLSRVIIKLYASTGVVTRVGNDFDSYGMGLVYMM